MLHVGWIEATAAVSCVWNCWVGFEGNEFGSEQALFVVFSAHSLDSTASPSGRDGLLLLGDCVI